MTEDFSDSLQLGVHPINPDNFEFGKRKSEINRESQTSNTSSKSLDAGEANDPKLSVHPHFVAGYKPKKVEEEIKEEEENKKEESKSSGLVEECAESQTRILKRLKKRFEKIVDEEEAALRAKYISQLERARKGLFHELSGVESVLEPDFRMLTDAEVKAFEERAKKIKKEIEKLNDEIKKKEEDVKNKMKPIKQDIEKKTKKIGELLRKFKDDKYLNDNVNPANHPDLWQNTSRAFTTKFSKKKQGKSSHQQIKELFDKIDGELIYDDPFQNKMRNAARRAKENLEGARKGMKRNFLFQLKANAGSGLLKELDGVEVQETKVARSSESISNMSEVINSGNIKEDLTGRIESLILKVSQDEATDDVFDWINNGRRNANVIHNKDDVLRMHKNIRDLGGDIERFIKENKIDEKKAKNIRGKYRLFQLAANRWGDPHYRNPAEYTTDEKIVHRAKQGSVALGGIFAAAAIICFFTGILAPVGVLALGLAALVGLFPLGVTFATAIGNWIRYGRAPTKMQFGEISIAAILLPLLVMGGKYLASLGMAIGHMLGKVIGIFGQQGLNGLAVPANGGFSKFLYDQKCSMDQPHTRKDLEKTESVDATTAHKIITGPMDLRSKTSAQQIRIVKSKKDENQPIKPKKKGEKNYDKKVSASDIRRHPKSMFFYAVPKEGKNERQRLYAQESKRMWIENRPLPSKHDATFFTKPYTKELNKIEESREAYKNVKNDSKMLENSETKLKDLKDKIKETLNLEITAFDRTNLRTLQGGVEEELDNIKRLQGICDANKESQSFQSPIYVSH